MRYLLITLILLSSHSTMFGQTLKGKVYDSKSIVKDIKVLNKTQNRLTVTDDEGNFSITAKVNDTIALKSVFYHPKEVILKQIHFDNLNVFEVKKIVNELDEVEIANTLENKFDSIAFYTTIESEKKKLSKKPLMQSGDNLMPTLDLKQLFKRVVKLFKKKGKESTYRQPITYKQMDSLYNNSSFFNKQLLTENLKIPEDKKYLFFDFCETQYISSELLKDENKMELLEQLVINSQLFLILLKEYGENKETKD